MGKTKAGSLERDVSDATSKETSAGGSRVDDRASTGDDLSVHNVTRDIWYATIQQAIDEAVDGDAIEVLPGTYVEQIILLGKAITLHSTNGPDVTIIDGHGGHTIRCWSGEDRDTIIAGFTATNGIHGMYNSFSSPTVNNCIFRGNSGGEYGGGMFNYNGSSPAVTNCVFLENSAQSGGGMTNYLDCSPIVTRCMFVGNTAAGSGAGDGGGMYNERSTRPEITECTFIGNSATQSGGGLYGSGTLTRCTFNENSGKFGGGVNGFSLSRVDTCAFNRNVASSAGGGLYGGASVVVNATFIENRAETLGGGLFGGGRYINCVFSGNSAETGGGIADLGRSAFVNCTVTANSASAIGGGIRSNYHPSVDPSTVTNCIVWGNVADVDPQISYENGTGQPFVSYSCVQGGWEGFGFPIIDADPLFGQYHALSAGSPCIDAGNNTAVPADVADLDGDGDVLEPTPLDLAGRPRFTDDPATADTGSTGLGFLPVVDIGAYEFSAGASHDPADLDHDGDVDLRDYALFHARFTGPR